MLVSVPSGLGLVGQAVSSSTNMSHDSFSHPTIQGTPNRSLTMPNEAAQNVLSRGMITVPPSLSAANACWACAVVA